MSVLTITVRIVRHVVSPGDKYGRLTVIAEVQKVAADGRRYRAALCRCDCGKETTPRISSLNSGDAQSCGCSRGQPKYQRQRCPVCGMPAMIRRGHRSCSRRCHRRHDGAVGEGNPRAKLTNAKVRQLRARRADGLTYRQLAAEFGISDMSACAAVNRKTWAHVS